MKNYTLAEAAAELRVSLRSMSNIVARHPHYYAVGNRKLFTEEDIQKIIAGLRDEAANRVGRAALPKSGLSLSNDQAMKKVLKLLSEGKAQKKR